MWLLNARTLELEVFLGTRAVKYAILSHTWGDEEVSFQELRGSQDSQLRSRKGYRKIQQTCRQALQDGFKYAWVDTCCINKESSAELSEAINSMFKWYAQSAVCYVYLEDVVLDFRLSSRDRHPHGYDIKAGAFQYTISKSRWFSRGWTLQELIAPSEVLFFDSRWEIIASRRDASRALSAITTIDETLLARQRTSLNLDCYSIAAKMAWAASRETTKPEDGAYCLLGLFGINMPLLYGEGTNAFWRLQQEILKHTDDQSILAWRDVLDLGSQTFSEACSPFASSPAQFLNLHDIVRWRDGPTTSFQLTNIALELQLPVLEVEDCSRVTGRYAVLNCHYKNDLRGPLALCISPPEPDASSEWDCIVLTRKCNMPSSYAKSVVPWSPNSLASTPDLGRTTVVPRASFSLARRTRLHLHLKPSTHLDSKLGIERPWDNHGNGHDARNIWIQLRQSSHCSATVARSGPENMWSSQGLFCCGRTSFGIGFLIWRLKYFPPDITESFVGVVLGMSHGSDIYFGFVARDGVPPALLEDVNVPGPSQSFNVSRSIGGFAAYATVPFKRSTKGESILLRSVVDGMVLRAKINFNQVIMGHLVHEIEVWVEGVEG